MIHFLWIFPLQIIFQGYLIWEKAQWAVVGVVVLLLQAIPLHTCSSYFMSLLRKRIALLTDNRVGIMSELIEGIQVIKMYAWEVPFHRFVAEARRLEIQQIRYASYIRGIDLSTPYFVERSTLFISIATYVLMGYTLSVDLVYTLYHYLHLLKV